MSESLVQNVQEIRPAIHIEWVRGSSEFACGGASRTTALSVGNDRLRMRHCTDAGSRGERTRKRFSNLKNRTTLSARAFDRS